MTQYNKLREAKGCKFDDFAFQRVFPGLNLDHWRCRERLTLTPAVARLRLNIAERLTIMSVYIQAIPHSNLGNTLRQENTATLKAAR